MKRVTTLSVAIKSNNYKMVTLPEGANCILCRDMPSLCPKSFLDMTLNYNQWWGSSYGVIRSVEVPLIAITPRSTLIQNGNTYLGSIYISNISVWTSLLLYRNTWNHIAVCRFFVLDRNTWYHKTVRVKKKLLSYSNKNSLFWLVWFVWFYGISTFVGYLTPNPFLCK